MASKFHFAEVKIFLNGVQVGPCYPFFKVNWFRPERFKVKKGRGQRRNRRNR